MPGQPGGGMPQAPMGQEAKEEGPAEAAPEDEGRPSDLEPLGGYAEQGKKKMQIFEIDGYMRMRTDYLYNFNLGQNYTFAVQPPIMIGGVTLPATSGLPPFPVPLACPAPRRARHRAKPCGTKGLGGANLRLRLEPTLNVTDQVRVHAQVDILDNTLMGSTPDSLVGINRSRPGQPAGRGAGAAAVHHPGSARGRPERLHRPASAPSAPGARSTASSARCASAACPGISAAGSPTTTAAAPTAISAPPSTG